MILQNHHDFGNTTLKFEVETLVTSLFSDMKDASSVKESTLAPKFQRLVVRYDLLLPFLQLHTYYRKNSLISLCYQYRCLTSLIYKI